jgi:hypothetical protein
MVPAVPGFWFHYTALVDTFLSLLNNLHEYFFFEMKMKTEKMLTHPEVSVDVCVHCSEVNHYLLHVYLVVFLVIYRVEDFLQRNMSSFHPCTVS